MATQTETFTTAKKASFWKRLIAYYIDCLTIVFFIAIAGRSLGIPDIIGDWTAAILYYFYNILCDQGNRPTLGKRIMHLRVIGVDGQKPDLKNSIYRNFGKIVSALPLLYGFLRILAPHHRQTIHDELGKCLVVDVNDRQKSRRQS